MASPSEQPEPVDVLAFGPHPDDVELWAGGLLLAMRRKGYRCVIVDLTRGEAGTRGSPEQRDLETAAANTLLGLVARENLRLADTRLEATASAAERLCSAVRRWRPRLVIGPSEGDLHPDHVMAARLVGRACELAGSSGDRRCPGLPHRIGALIRYCGYRDEAPSFVVDVGGVWKEKLELISCYRTQLGLDDPVGPVTNLTLPRFLAQYEARYAYWGARIGARYGEPFVADALVSIDDPVAVLTRRGRA